MNTRTTVLAVVALLICCLIAVATLSALHDDSSQVVGITTGSIIPTMAALFGFKAASDAKASADKAVENTNGILHAAIAAQPPATTSDADVAAALTTPPPAPPAEGDTPPGVGKPPR